MGLRKYTFILLLFGLGIKNTQAQSILKQHFGSILTVSQNDDFSLVHGNSLHQNQSNQMHLTSQFIHSGVKKMVVNKIAFTLMPNPTSGIFHVKTSATIDHINVYDNAGRLAMKTDFTTIDLSDLANGPYTININTTDNISVSSILILQK